MVTYLPSYDTKTVTIVAAPPVEEEVPTSLTLDGISGTPQAGDSFTVSGTLIRTTMPGGGLAGFPVRISVNGSTVRTVTTQSGSFVAGVFEASISIAEAGTYTIRADFDGATVSGMSFAPSSGSTVLGIEMGDILSALPVIIGAAVLGIILVR